jgi:pantothenate kinase type III
MRGCHYAHHYAKAQVEQFEHEQRKTVGVVIAVACYFLPESRLAKAILAGIGIGTALSYWLATEAGAYVGCFVAGGVVTLFEVL